MTTKSIGMGFCCCGFVLCFIGLIITCETFFSAKKNQDAAHTWTVENSYHFDIDCNQDTQFRSVIELYQPKNVDCQVHVAHTYVTFSHPTVYAAQKVQLYSKCNRPAALPAPPAVPIASTTTTAVQPVPINPPHPPPPVQPVPVEPAPGDPPAAATPTQTPAPEATPALASAFRKEDASSVEYLARRLSIEEDIESKGLEPMASFYFYAEPSNLHRGRSQPDTSPTSCTIGSYRVHSSSALWAFSASDRFQEEDVGIIKVLLGMSGLVMLCCFGGCCSCMGLCCLAMEGAN